MGKKCFTTGILNKDADTQFAHVDIVNLDCECHWVNVKVINWSNPNRPTEVYVTPKATMKISPGTAQFFNANLAGTPCRYEIRITMDDDVKMIANCFGVSDPCRENKNQEGNTVLFKDLILLDDEDDDD